MLSRLFARDFGVWLFFLSLLRHLQLDCGVRVFGHGPSFLCASGGSWIVTVEPGGEHGGLFGGRLITQ
jgi:hypothetical protein